MYHEENLRWQHMQQIKLQKSKKMIKNILNMTHNFSLKRTLENIHQELNAFDYFLTGHSAFEYWGVKLQREYKDLDIVMSEKDFLTFANLLLDGKCQTTWNYYWDADSTKYGDGDYKDAQEIESMCISFQNMKVDIFKGDTTLKDWKYKEIEIYGHKFKVLHPCYSVMYKWKYINEILERLANKKILSETALTSLTKHIKDVNTYNQQIKK